MITSPENDKLKLVRKLAQRKWRRREGAFVTEGEDLLGAGLDAGVQPLFVLTPADSGIEGIEVEPRLFEAVTTLASGTRAIAVWPQRLAGGTAAGAVATYLHGVGDPGNVGTIVRSAQALLGGPVLLGPGCADPYGPRAVRASMGAIFGCELREVGIEDAPPPRVALTAQGGQPLEALGAEARTLVLGAEREGLPPELIAECEGRITIATRPGAVESLNVAAAAAIAMQRIASLADG